jgi:hypothetical protein
MHKLSSLNIQLENLKAVLSDLQVQSKKEEEIRKIILQIKEVEKLISKQSIKSN